MLGCTTLIFIFPVIKEDTTVRRADDLPVSMFRQTLSEVVLSAALLTDGEGELRRA